MNIGGNVLQIPRDIANLLKKHADPISYGRLLRVWRIFQPTDPARYERKLRQLLKELPQDMKPKRPSSAYMYFVKHRSPEVRCELQGAPDLFVIVSRQIGAEWGRMTDDDKQPFVDLAKKDKIRYETQCKKSVWDQLMHHRNLAGYALARKDDKMLYKIARQKDRHMMNTRRSNRNKLFMQKYNDRNIVALADMAGGDYRSYYTERAKYI